MSTYKKLFTGSNLLILSLGLKIAYLLYHNFRGLQTVVQFTGRINLIYTENFTPWPTVPLCR